MRGRSDAQGELRSILEEREPLYSKAERILDTDALSIREVVDLLVQGDESLEAVS